MSNIGSYPTRALLVIPSDYCDIPTPNVLTSGTITTENGIDVISDENALFYADSPSGQREYRVNAGDVIYFYETGKAATITLIKNETSLVINSMDGAVVGDSYVIYQQSEATGISNKGCILHIGGAEATENIALTTIGGDSMSISPVLPGILPIQVKKVLGTGTTASEIYALW